MCTTHNSTAMAGPAALATLALKSDSFCGGRNALKMKD